MQILQNYSITTITDIKQSKQKDKLGTIKKITSYKCKWMQPENQNYTMWMTSNKVFPHNQQNIAKYNLTLLKQFYLAQQHIRYYNIIEKTFRILQSQSKDARYIHEPLHPPLIQINLNECNPASDINASQPTIQII
jgi:hypothetical protein